MKMIILFFLACMTMISFTVNGQDKYFTKTGKIYFNCNESALEKIEAINKSGNCVLDAKTGKLQFAVLMKGFEFEKALMQEHFNENYVECSKYPKAEFKGQVINNDKVKYNADVSYTIKVRGSLFIHGETNDVETTGTFQVKNGNNTATAGFIIQHSDFKISIPLLVSDKISNTVNMPVDCLRETLKS